MGNCSVKSICRRVLEPFPGGREALADQTPCMEPFPEGLGPLSVRATHLRAGDVLVFGLDDTTGGTIRLNRKFFDRSRALRILEARLDAYDAWSLPLPTKSQESVSSNHSQGAKSAASSSSSSVCGAVGAALELRTSPSHAVTPVVRKALGIPLAGEVHFAWVYPVPFECSTLPKGNDASVNRSRSKKGHEENGRNGDATSVTYNALPGTSSHNATLSPRGTRPKDEHGTKANAITSNVNSSETSGSANQASTYNTCAVVNGVANPSQKVAGGVRCEEEEIDTEDPDVSFLTVGGYIYFRPSRETSSDPRSFRTPLMRHGWPMELDLLSARSIRFSPAGALQFSAPRRWEPAWTQRLSQQGRFQPITARKWVAAGARYVCWVRPDEPLPDARGRDRPLAHHGGFAFLFHDLEEMDAEGLDRYFEVVAEPDLGKVESASSSGLRHGSTGSNETGGSRGSRGERPEQLRRCTSSLPFNLVAAPPGHESRLLGKLLQLARRERWSLVRHLIAEYPHLAAAAGDEVEGGTTLLHVCAERDVLDAELLGLLKEHGASCEATDSSGRKPEELGSRSFRALVRSVWGLSPDLFEDPEGWFRFWDRNASGVLEPEELAAALASAYRCSEVGAQWVKSYVNIHHRSGISKTDLLGEHGMLHTLQTSEEFAGLRQQRTPPLFRGQARCGPKCEEARAKLFNLEARLEHLRIQHGWEAGRPAPRAAMPLLLPAPIPDGAIDPVERLRTARGILGFSFEQTRTLPGRAWQNGFRVDFAGQEGLDDGGLTKAWVSEISFALWGDSAFFDAKPGGSFFKPDEIELLHPDDVPVRSSDLYRWTGRFVAYALYQRCLMDCRLVPWAFRVLHRAATPLHCCGARNEVPDWPDTPEGEDAMLSDLASLDHAVASNLWRVRHELNEEDLRWLDFTCAGVELKPGGGECEVTYENKAAYVRRFCTFLLQQRCHHGLQAFTEGFFEVVPSRLLADIPEEGALWLLAGRAEVSDAQVTELERVVIPGGLVPAKLSDHPQVREAAGWLFRAARAGDGAFRTRLLEFWIGVGRVPLAGLHTVRPKPRLQVMVQPDGRGGLKRISSWPKSRLPEGHTCGNELWMALPDSYAEAEMKLKQAVENFESGFALR